MGAVCHRNLADQRNKAQSGICEPHQGDATMHMSNESLLVILFVGLVAGWLAGQIVRGTGLGIVGDLLFGILGAFSGAGCCLGLVSIWVLE